LYTDAKWIKKQVYIYIYIYKQNRIAKLRQNRIVKIFLLFALLMLRAGASFFFILGKLWFWLPFFKIFGKMSNYLQRKKGHHLVFGAPKPFLHPLFSKKYWANAWALLIWKRRALCSGCIYDNVMELMDAVKKIGGKLYSSNFWRCTDVSRIQNKIN
jgi:hypothetical protein